MCATVQRRVTHTAPCDSAHCTQTEWNVCQRRPSLLLCGTRAVCQPIDGIGEMPKTENRLRKGIEHTELVLFVLCRTPNTHNCWQQTKECGFRILCWECERDCVSWRRTMTLSLWHARVRTVARTTYQPKQQQQHHTTTVQINDGDDDAATADVRGKRMRKIDTFLLWRWRVVCWLV